ncbi:TetR-like C-terminal domain-containing protein [Ruania zhangjianzhongii]|uniref:TetR-like C-terminal domain-containing protein n=1 Tax=Ruania zhangjianzhongii TaxID=2603206 RepID=UPI001F33A5CF|nr:TetR-like C-terminal domain-containing protein [Ruania zhangjianzhongii]
MTVRRLAAAIGYSQPVLYQHFPHGRPEIIAAVARSGFAQLADRVPPEPTHPEAVAQTARAYLAFAREHSALYAAMFEMPSLNRFASEQTPAQLRRAFDALVVLFGQSPDADTRTELFWSMLHGVAVLERDGRLPPQQREERITEIAQIFG